MNEKERLKELERELSRLNTRQVEIRREVTDLRSRIATEKYASSVGKCYKHDNRYCTSCGGERKPWYVYSRILSVYSEDSTGEPVYITESIQKTVDGRIEYNPKAHESMHAGVGAWREIPRSEFEEMKKKILCSA